MPVNRFGDFTLLEELGSSELADRFRAVHDTHGGPFFLKCYHRLPPDRGADLVRRADRLIGQRHPNLCQHMGHGDTDGVYFVVAPLVEGVTLADLLEKCRVVNASLKPSTALYIAREVASGLSALHGLGDVNPMTHGELSAEHVRITPEGQVMVTGIPTPRSLVAGQPLSIAWDTMGLAALLYDLFGGTRLKAKTTELPGSVAVEAQRALTPSDQTTVNNLVHAIDETARQLGFATLDRTGLLEIMSRARARPAADPLLDELPTLEPLAPPKESPAIGPHVAGGALRRAEPVATETPAAVPAPAPVTVDDLELPKAAPPPPPTPTPAPPQPVAAPKPPAPKPTAPAPRPKPPARPSPPPAAKRPPPLPTPPPAPFGKTAPQPLMADPTTPDSGPLPSKAPAPPLAGQLGGLASLPVDETDPFASTHPRVGSTPRESSRPGGFLADPVEVTAPQPAAPGPSAPPSAPRDKAVSALLSQQIIDEDQLANAASIQKRKGGRLLEIVMKSVGLDDGKVADALAAAARKVKVSSRELEERLPGPELVRRLPQTYVLARRVLPLKLEGGVLELVVLDPFDHATIDEIQAQLGAAEVNVGVVARKALARGAKKAYARIGVSADPLDAQEGPIVLVCVPDTEVLRIGARFADEGMSVEHAANSNLARQIIVDHPPDAIVCAAELLPRDGDSLLTTVRARPDLEEDPFFVVGEPDDLAAAAYVELGADDYFDRPLNLDVLVAKLRRAVGKRRRRKKSAAATAPIMSESSLPPGHIPAADISGLADLPDLGGPADVLNPLTAPVGAPVLSAPPFTDPAVSQEFGVVQDAPPIQPTGVMGTLKQMAVADIVQSLELGRKTARVELHPMTATEESGPDKGMLGFTDGMCTYAEYGGELGDEAFYKLARFTEGFFRIRYGEGPPAQNITKQTQFLLLEAMRIMDEQG